MKKVLRTIMFAAALTATAHAQLAYVNYQGRLTDDVGQPLPGGSYRLTFNIYDAPTGGTLVWGPFQCDGAQGIGHAALAIVANGRFNVVLGPQDTAGRAIPDAFGSGNRFIEIAVTNGAPILPRQQFLSNPYAFAINNSRYELTGTSMKAKGTNQLVFGDATSNAVSGAISSQAATGLEILGSGTNANRRITLTGSVSIPGSATIGGGATISGTLQATTLSDGARSMAMVNVLREDPPFTMNIISVGQTTRWQLTELDLQQHCDDDDGCTIRVYMQHEISGEVRWVEEKIYLERPGFTETPNTNVKLRNLQIASDESHLWGRSITLGDSAREIVWEAWDWIWASDYRQGLRVGEQDGNAETGNRRFRIHLAVHPHVSVKVILFDH